MTFVRETPSTPPWRSRTPPSTRCPSRVAAGAGAAKRTFYADEVLIDRIEDLMLQWRRKYLRHYGKFPTALIEDAFLAEALSRVGDVERRLKHILDGGDPQAKLNEGE